MGNKYTKRYTEEFKRDAIALVDSSGKTVTAAAQEVGISSESLRGWYRQAKAARGDGAPGELKVSADGPCENAIVRYTPATR